VSLDELRDAAWRRVLAAARRRLEATGGSLTGSVGLRSPTEAERRLIIGITGTHRSSTVARVRLPLSELDDWLRQAHGVGLAEVLSIVDGQPVRDRPADRLREALARDTLLVAARRSPHAGAPWFEAWLEEIASDGTLTRLVRRASDDLTSALAVLDRLPADGVPLPVLAETALGDTKGLSGTPAAGLVLRALAVWQGVPAPSAPSAAEDERALWDDAGVIVDDLASQVLVLNLPSKGGMVADWLNSAAMAGLPFRLTLHQLSSSPVVPSVDVVYVCENPAVLRAAAGGPCAPLMCTEGAASVACRRLVAAVVAAGAQVLWRNDFDWPGLRMTAAALERFGAQPWRMGRQDYGAAGPGGTPLRGAPAASPWDPELAEMMARTGTSVMEERLLSHLLADLRRA